MSDAHSRTREEDKRMSRVEAETPPDEVAVVRRLADSLSGAERLAVVSVLAELLRLRRDGGRLGDEVQALIQRKVIDVRSPAGDALLDFRDPPRTERGDRLATVDAEVAELRRMLSVHGRRADTLQERVEAESKRADRAEFRELVEREIADRLSDGREEER